MQVLPQRQAGSRMRFTVKSPDGHFRPRQTILRSRLGLTTWEFTCLWPQALPIPGYYDESGSWGFDMKSFVQSDGSLLPVEMFTDRARVSVHVNGISDFSDNEVLEVALALIDENSESKPTHVRDRRSNVL